MRLVGRALRLSSILLLPRRPFQRMVVASVLTFPLPEYQTIAV
jgi:hypothetical protein